jgi:hypothetical protein
LGEVGWDWHGRLSVNRIVNERLPFVVRHGIPVQVAIGCALTELFGGERRALAAAGLGIASQRQEHLTLGMIP